MKFGAEPGSQSKHISSSHLLTATPREMSRPMPSPSLLERRESELLNTLAASSPGDAVQGAGCIPMLIYHLGEQLANRGASDKNTGSPQRFSNMDGDGVCNS